MQAPSIHLSSHGLKFEAQQKEREREKEQFRERHEHATEADMKIRAGKCAIQERRMKTEGREDIKRGQQGRNGAAGKDEVE
mmetsp:Transcript_35251/g.69556  ORF Transcript_35251/g.69556 Transcript_35251/m.69556 type:complete len:81 (-) Transcript_35251:686-928(-)